MEEPNPGFSSSFVLPHGTQAQTLSLSLGNRPFQVKACKYLLPARELLDEFCSLGGGGSVKRNGKQQSDPSSSCVHHSLCSMEPLELHRRKDKLLAMLQEVDKRYGRYSEQMTAVVAAFEAVAGEGAARTYSVLASKAMSRHFRCLRDGIVTQLRAMGDGAPGLTPRLRLLDQSLRQHEAFQHAGMLDVAHPWRPQRGLPGRSVSILRAWLFEHFLHPYPSDVDKLILARQTGLSRGQVSNWFINARVRLWKPMVEEMYLEEMKEEKKSNDQFPCTTIKHGGGSNPYPNDPSSQPHYETHMTSSIVSNVNTHHQNFDVLNTGSNFYDMDELTLGLQRCQGPSSLAREEVGDDHEFMSDAACGRPGQFHSIRLKGRAAA
ncbi:hypothetical protein HPP92_002733 [Vanilla planifolia]|uniref:Homeobox domain-containing protein n=1 Tax=Vanilla planifolia TaxID=51239 RepID=A0A835S5V4_VANPL|nr:hypothetical protein HPP92_002733 [Vanilla planifolia]